MANVTGSDYQLRRSTGVCAATGRAISPGQRVVSALVEREDGGGFDRLDYSAEAWEGGARPKDMIGFWRRIEPEPDAKPKLLIEDDELLNLFDQLEDEEEQSRMAFRFLLALILVRKRLLNRVGRQRRDGREIMLVRRRGENAETPPSEVVDPGMDERTLAAAKEQLNQALRGQS